MRKIKLETIIIPFLWVALSIFTFFVFYAGNDNFKWIDIPTHFAGGMFVALIINGKGPVTDFKKTFILSFLVFLSWELFEIIASTVSHRELIVDIFEETVANKTQDVVMGVLGFIGFVAIRR